MLKIIEYHIYKKRNLFVRALACFSPFLRFKSSRRLWMGLRLGLYKTVNNEVVLFNTQRIKGVKLIAKIKRRDHISEEVFEDIEQYLLSCNNTSFRKEFVRETIYLVPSFYFKFFNENPYLLSDEHYLLLYLSLLVELDISPKDQKLPLKWNKFVKSKAPLLYSNISVSNTTQKIDIINEQLRLHHLTPIRLIDVSKNINVKNLASNKCLYKLKYNLRRHLPKQKVTILVTVYNTASALRHNINSLLNQTWLNIEVIIINDASTDNSLEVIKDIELRDDRVVAIDLPKNVGTFAAKNIGAKFATGDFLTCHDSDDWAHPQKIELQVNELIEDEKLIATTSQWVRINSKGRYHVRQYYPYIKQNPSSPLFHREQVTNDIGLWHNTRTGADSEFLERVKLFYGPNRVKNIEGVLTFGSYRQNSLTTSDSLGSYNKKASLVRLDYWESWRMWHINCLYNNRKIYIPPICDEQTAYVPEISIPKLIKVNKKDYLYNLKTLQNSLLLKGE